MTNVTLAAYSHLAVYSSIVVLTLAMIAFAMDLAGAVPRTVARPEGARLLVGAGAPAASGNVPAPAAGASAEHRRKAAGVAMAPTRLGGLLVLGGVSPSWAIGHAGPLGKHVRVRDHWVGFRHRRLVLCLRNSAVVL